MEFLSKLKNIGTSVSTNVKLCGKSWSMLESNDSVTLIFKSNKTLHLIVNGVSKVVPWDFSPLSETLIIYSSGASGISYHVKFVNEQTLILYNEETKKNEYYSNKNSNNAPTNSEESFVLYASNNIEYMKSAYADILKTKNNIKKKKATLNDIQNAKFNKITDHTDNATKGLDGEDIIKCVDVFKKIIPTFKEEYVRYLEYHLKTGRFLDYGVYGLGIVRDLKRNEDYYPKNSNSLNYYIDTTGDSVANYQ